MLHMQLLTLPVTLTRKKKTQHHQHPLSHFRYDLSGHVFAYNGFSLFDEVPITFHARNPPAQYKTWNAMIHRIFSCANYILSKYIACIIKTGMNESRRPPTTGRLTQNLTSMKIVVCLQQVVGRCWASSVWHHTQDKLMVNDLIRMWIVNSFLTDEMIQFSGVVGSCCVERWMI